MSEKRINNSGDKVSKKRINTATFLILLAVVIIGLLLYARYTFINEQLPVNRKATLPITTSKMDSLQNSIDSSRTSIDTSTTELPAKKPENTPPVIKKAFFQTAKSPLATRGYYSTTVKYNGVQFDVFAADLRKTVLRMHWKDATGAPYQNLGKMKTRLEGSGAEKMLFATNGGIYSTQATPEGLFVAKGAEQSPLNTKDGGGNFYLKPNGVFAVDENQKAYVVPTEEYLALKNKTKIQYATQSGPLLRYDGVMHKAFNKGSANTNIRNGVGVMSANAHIAVFVITRQECNLYTFSQLFQDELGCRDALYLDGVISRMYIDGSSKRKDLDGNFVSIINVSKK